MKIMVGYANKGATGSRYVIGGRDYRTVTEVSRCVYPPTGATMVTVCLIEPFGPYNAGHQFIVDERSLKED